MCSYNIQRAYFLLETAIINEDSVLDHLNDSHRLHFCSSGVNTQCHQQDRQLAHVSSTGHWSSVTQKYLPQTKLHWEMPTCFFHSRDGSLHYWERERGNALGVSYNSRKKSQAKSAWRHLYTNVGRINDTLNITRVVHIDCFTAIYMDCPIGLSVSPVSALHHTFHAYSTFYMHCYHKVLGNR